MWIIVTMAIIAIMMIITDTGRGPNPKQIEKKRRETRRRCEELTKDITVLIDVYSNTENHSAEETRTAWRKCQTLLADSGIVKEGAIFRFSEVRTGLNRKVWESMRGKHDRKETDAFMNAVEEKLLDFYYRVAFTYDLIPDDQAELMHYLSLINSVINGVNWDVKRLALYEEGCRKNSPLAMRYLADCYYKKIGMDLKDYDKAFALYQQAAKLGDIRAVYMLGQCYEYSRGTKTDYQKAGDCYRYAYEVAKSQDPASILTQDCAKASGRLYDGNRWDKNRYSPDIFTCDTPVMKKANLDKIKQDLAKCMQADLDTADLSILAVSIGMINEEIINSFIECYESGYQKEKPSEQIKILRNRGYFTKEIFYQTTTVRSLRNRGAHNRKGEPITLDEIKQAMRYIKNIVEYYEQF